MKEISNEVLKIELESSDSFPTEFLNREVILRDGPDSPLFSQREGGGLGLEQFRMLQARLTELQSKQSFKRLLITSAIQGEGKTHVAANLALTLASEGHRKVLLIDADVRKPALHLAYGIPNEYGFTNWLHDGCNPWKVVSKIKGVELYVVTSGTAACKSLSPSNISSLQTLLDLFGSGFDLILLDSPPLLATADAKLLSGVTDAVLMVVRAGKTPRELFLKAKQLLEGRSVVGVVLNRVDPSQTGYDFYQKYDVPGRKAQLKAK